MTNPHASFEEIDPARAEVLLKANTRNRTLARSKVLHYAARMQAGRWMLTGQAHVIVGSDGVLLNGQHTLAAVVESGETIRTLVVHGIDPVAFSAIDTGMKRSAGAILQAEGWSYGSDIGAAIRLLIISDSINRSRSGTYTIRSGQIDPDEIEEVFKIDPNLWQESAALTRSANRGRGFGGRAAPIAFRVLADRAGHDMATVDAFITHVFSDEEHRAGAPATTLRRYLQGTYRHRSGAGVESSLATLSSWIRCWNAHIAGETLARLFAWNRAAPSFPTVARTPHV